MNQHYKTLIAILSATIGEQHWHDWILTALADNSTPRSKSCIQGWAMSPENRKFRHMAADDFQDVLNAIYNRLNREKFD